MTVRPFGPVVTAGHVRRAVKALLSANLPPVLAELSDRAGLDPLAPPNGYGGGIDPTAVLDVPLGLIVVPTLSARPVHLSDGTYELPWDVAVAIAMRRKSRDACQDVAEIYAAATRVTVLQTPSLGGMADSTEWVDEQVDEIGFDSGGSVWAATEVFQVIVTASADGYASPTVPVPITEAFTAVQILIRGDES